ncbi:MAG: hypothetical protein KKH52_03665 [Nanoarchaeota archaeon]|nr:hypothetical protein [Nanoarchaeota archaeon]MBU1622340.1 hypothetical protein [Nanoarchaeota archaeon]MBU1974465.1 hypothetical protein [Nanoarchaeota archaeon]
MVKKYFLLFLVLLVLAIGVQADSDCLYYFYGEGEGCPGCLNTTLYLDQLAEQDPNLQLQKFEVYQNIDNFHQLQEYFSANHVPVASQGIPAIFLPGSYFVGEKAILELLEGRLKDNQDESCPGLTGEVIGIVGEKSSANVLDTLSLVVITKSAFKDWFSLSALAVLVVFLLMLLFKKNKILALKASVSFIFGLFLVYFLIGIGIIPHFNFSYFFPKIVGALAIILGLVVLFDFLSKRLFLGFVDRLKRITSAWVALLLGGLIGFFSACGLGEKYPLLSSLIQEASTRGMAIFLILFYLLLIIIPLALLVVIIYQIMAKLDSHAHGKKEKPKLWKTHNYHLFKFFLGMVVIVLGIFLILF